MRHKYRNLLLFTTQFESKLRSFIRCRRRAGWKQKLRERRVSYIKSIGRNFWNLYTSISLSFCRLHVFFLHAERADERSECSQSQQCNFLSAIIMYVSEFVFCHCCVNEQGTRWWVRKTGARKQFISPYLSIKGAVCRQSCWWIYYAASKM